MRFLLYSLLILLVPASASADDPTRPVVRAERLGAAEQPAIDGRLDEAAWQAAAPAADFMRSR